MALDSKGARALVPGAKSREVVMATKTIKVIRKFYIGGVLQEIGKVVIVSEIEALGYVGTHKAEYVPFVPEKIEKEKVKEETQIEAPKEEEVPIETKKGGKKNVSI